MSKHYKNETGTDFLLDTGVNIGTVAFQFIKYYDPTGVSGTWDAELYDSYSSLSGLTGTQFLKRTLGYNDFSVSGEWKFQAYVAAASGTWYGETVKLNVFDQFE